MPRPRTFLLASIALYLLACALPAIQLRTGGNDYGPHLEPHWHWIGLQSLSGISLLFSSLFGPFFLNFSGLANPLLWMSWFLFRARRYPAAFWPATVASLFAAETFQLIWQPYYFDEAGAVRGFFTGRCQAGIAGWRACWSLCLRAAVFAAPKIYLSIWIKSVGIDNERAKKSDWERATGK